MNRRKTRLILGAVLGILGLAWAVLGAMPLFASGVGTQCDGKFLFKMNIIGVDNPKNAKMTNTDRKTIFVALGANGAPVKSNIFLTQGAFMVCDGNSWDQAYDCFGNPIGNFIGAVFQLPCNLNAPGGTNCTGVSACYDVFFRALGTPGGNATITTCGVLAGTTTIVCDSGNAALVSRNKGTPTFSKVTNQLTSIFGKELFNSDFQFFLWQYDNQGLKNGMVVFCGANCAP